MTTSLSGLTLVLTICAAQTEGVALRWKLTRGDTFYTRTVSEMNQTVEVAGMKMEQKQDQTIVHRYRVQEAGPKGYVIEQTVTKAEIEGNLPVGAELAGRMKGSVLLYTLDEKFQVTKVEGYEKYLEKISGDDEMTRKLLKTYVTEENLKLGINELFGLSAPAMVRPGDDWKQEKKMSLGPLGSFELVTKFKLAGIENGVAKVVTNSEAKYEAPKEQADAGGFTISKGELKAEKFTGTILFDTRAGRLKEGRSEMKTSGTLTVAVGGMDAEIGFNQTLTTTTTLSDKNLGDD